MKGEGGEVKIGMNRYGFTNKFLPVLNDVGLILFLVQLNFLFRYFGINIVC